MSRSLIAKPLFVVVRGLPGAGKTGLVDELLKLSMLKGSLRLDPDRVDQTKPEFLSFCTTQTAGLPSKKKVYRYLLRQAEKALRAGRNVVWEQPWRLVWGIYITVENLVYFLTGEANLNQAPFQTLVVEISIDLEEAKRRVAQRFARGEHLLDVDDFENFVSGLEDCRQLGFPFVRVNGTAPIEEAVSLIKTYLSRLTGGDQ